MISEAPRPGARPVVEPRVARSALSRARPAAAAFHPGGACRSRFDRQGAGDDHCAPSWAISQIPPGAGSGTLAGRPGRDLETEVALKQRAKRVVRAIEMRSGERPASGDLSQNPVTASRVASEPACQEPGRVQVFQSNKRRGRDSNPRRTLRPLTVFETSEVSLRKARRCRAKAIA